VSASADAELLGWLRDMTHMADTLAEGEAAGRAADSPPEALPLPRMSRTAVFRLLVKHTFKDIHAYFSGGVGQAIRDVVTEALGGLDGAPLSEYLGSPQVREPVRVLLDRLARG
jgi:hypothetical protein